MEIETVLVPESQRKVFSPKALDLEVDLIMFRRLRPAHRVVYSVVQNASLQNALMEMHAPLRGTQYSIEDIGPALGIPDERLLALMKHFVELQATIRAELVG